MRRIAIAAAVGLAAVTVLAMVATMETIRRSDRSESLAAVTKAPPARPAEVTELQERPDRIGGAGAPQRRLMTGVLAVDGVEVPGARAQADAAPAAVPPAAPPAVAPAPPAVALAALGEGGWGRPGDAGQARVLEVEIRELHDGRMFFDPVLITVGVGEQLRFVFRNSGEFAHGVVIAPEREILGHVAEVKRQPETWRTDANWLYLAPGERGEMVWQFTTAGQFEFADVLPGNRDAGLTGRIVVR